MNGIEFVFDNQTVLILVLCVKTVCGIDLLSFNKILQCMQIPLIVCSPGVKTMSHGMSHRCLMDVVLVFRGRICHLGSHLRFVIRLDVA